MVGKPNLPLSHLPLNELKPAQALESLDLPALDAERAASMADEGGASALSFEGHEATADTSPRRGNLRRLPQSLENLGERVSARFGRVKKPRFVSPWLWLAGGVLVGMTGTVLLGRLRNRVEPALQPE
jgi:hypothetical protein